MRSLWWICVKMPHVLVAGATGQGKSVGLNAIITSLLYKKHPAELKFVLVDPKKVEFSIYSVIEHHFLAKLPDGEDAIITDVTKVVQTLNSICIEMDTRYDLLKAAHVRNIKEYNEKFINRRLNPEKGHKFMPYIVVVIDEFGDLIMTAGKDVELPIARIAQLARAVGIHMIIASGESDNSLRKVCKGENIGTLFVANDQGVSQKHHWVAYGKRLSGSITIDEGCTKAVLHHGASILPAGIIEVDGSFEPGDTVSIIAKGKNR